MIHVENIFCHGFKDLICAPFKGKVSFNSLIKMTKTGTILGLNGQQYKRFQELCFHVYFD